MRSTSAPVRRHPADRYGTRHWVVSALVLTMLVMMGCKKPASQSPPESATLEPSATSSPTETPAESSGHPIESAQAPSEESAETNDVAVADSGDESSPGFTPTQDAQPDVDTNESDDPKETLVATAETDLQPETGDASLSVNAETSASAENQPERLLLLTPHGPLIFDLTVWVDDQPYRQLMDQTIDEVLMLADDNQDGRVSWDELTQSPRFIYGQFGNVMINTERQRQDVIDSYDINRNSRVDRNEVPGFLVQNARSSRIFRLEAQEIDEESMSQVFQWLDVDQDRHLSGSEQSSAAIRLRYLDSNADDTLVADELVTSNADNMANANRQRRYGQESAVLLGDYTDWPALLFLLEERYGFGNRLVPSDFDLLGGPFRDLDLNEDNEIDLDEIERIAVVPPHFTVTYGFGSNEERTNKGIEVGEIREELTRFVQQSTVGEVIHLKFEHIEVSLSRYDQQGNSQLDALDAVWKQADGDENDYLDETEFQQAARLFTDVPFAAIDENEDDRVFRDEATAYLRRRASALKGRLQATVGVQTDSLLAYLDQDNDQRLTSRELRSLSERLARLDLNSDGQINAAEIPRAMTIRVDRGNPGGANVPPPDRRTAGRSESPDALNWFVNMDANRDGELSAKEFLGTDELFRQLDLNGDGFVDGNEAK